MYDQYRPLLQNAVCQVSPLRELRKKKYKKEHGRGDPKLFPGELQKKRRRSEMTSLGKLPFDNIQ